MHTYLLYYVNVKCGFIFLRYSYKTKQKKIKQNRRVNVKFFDETILNENFLILLLKDIHIHTNIHIYFTM